MFRLPLYVASVIGLTALSASLIWSVFPIVVVGYALDQHDFGTSSRSLAAAAYGFVTFLIVLAHLPIQPRIVDIWRVLWRLGVIALFVILVPWCLVFLVNSIWPNIETLWYVGVWGLATFLTLMGAYVILFADRPLNEWKRGLRLVTFLIAQSRADSARPLADGGISWGGVLLPTLSAVLHFLIVGAPGSGKTLTIRLLMQSVLGTIVPGEDLRALIYDAKQDMLPLLAGMRLSSEVVTLNPFDTRCAAWDMASDITSPATAYQTSSILIPEEKNSSQPFFSDAARDLLAGAIIALMITRGQDWDFRDLIMILRNPSRLRQLLVSTSETSDLLVYLTVERTTLDILATLSTKMAPFRPVAAAWSRATRKVSIREWIEGDFILVLGNDETSRAAVDAINRVIFQRITELVLAQPESTAPRFWFFLDEIRAAGRLPLSTLMAKVRSKGGCVVLAMQDPEGLKDVYGEAAALEILAQAAHTAIFRLASGHAAKWASDLVGHYDAMEVHMSEGYSYHQHGGYSVNLAEHYVKKEAVLPSQFMSIPPCTRENGLSGYYISPVTGVFFSTLDGHYLNRNLSPHDSRVPDLMPRPESDQYLGGDDDLGDTPDEESGNGGDPKPDTDPDDGTGQFRRPYSHGL